jgi:hypothetical protein
LRSICFIFLNPSGHQLPEHTGLTVCAATCSRSFNRVAEQVLADGGLAERIVVA